MKKFLLFCTATTVLAACSSSNEFYVDTNGQQMIAKASLKHVVISVQNEILSDTLFTPPYPAALKLPVLPQNAKIKIENAGGDRGPFISYYQTDSSGRLISEIDFNNFQASDTNR